MSAVPIIVLSARGQEQDKIDALDGGADDYLTQALQRRRAPGAAAGGAAPRRQRGARGDGGGPCFAVQDIEVDLARRVVPRAGEEIHLTPIEYKLLTTLIRAAGKVLTHRQLLGEVFARPATGRHHWWHSATAQFALVLERDPARPSIPDYGCAAIGSRAPSRSGMEVGLPARGGGRPSPAGTCGHRHRTRRVFVPTRRRSQAASQPAS